MKDNFRSILNFQKNSTASERGFTILLAALIASLVLSLGVSIFSIAQKQLILSSIGRNSQFAFYAADTGVECALYWDLRHDRFDIGGPAASSISCDTDTNITVTHTTRADLVTHDFTAQFAPNGYCVQLIVTKKNVHPRTTIHADGFSTDCANVQASSRVLQRSVELTY